MSQELKTARFEARIPPDVHSMIKRAAEIEGRTMTDYVMANALEAARSTIERTETLKLSRQNAEVFADMMLNPPEPAPAMQRAAEHRQRLLRQK